MKTVVRLALAVAIGVLGLAAPAASDTIHVSSVALSYYENLSIASFTVGSGSTLHTYGGNPSQASGQILLTTNIGPIGSWCVDLFHTIGGGPYDLTPIPLATDNSGSSTGTSNALTADQIQKIQSLAAYGNSQLPFESNKNAFAAAIQAEIWIVEYGATITGSAAFATALSAIQALLPTLPLSDGVQLANLSGTGADLFTVQHVAYPVPEPGTLALVGSILVALGLLARRRRPSATTSSI